MDSSRFSTLLKNRKEHPFLALCLSMVATGIAAELIYATSGRFSVAGDRVLQLIPFGIILYGILEHFFPELSRKYRHLAPIALLICGIGLLTIDGVPFSALVSAGFGVIIGLFICAALVSFLESGNTQNLGLKVGISASLFSVAVYPLSMGYRQLSKLFPKTSIITIGLVYCGENALVGSVVVYAYNKGCTAVKMR